MKKTTEEIATFLGEAHQVGNLEAIREWHGEAAVERALEAAEQAPEFDRGPEFFRSINAQKAARKASGDWPAEKYRDAKGDE